MAITYTNKDKTGSDPVNKWRDIDANEVKTVVNTNETTMDTHIANVSNPHLVTKTQVGLGNVDNTSDATKNAATATLTNKTLTSPIINTPTGIVKGDVGLGNVDNTSDANKPVSTAQATALALKVAKSGFTSISFANPLSLPLNDENLKFKTTLTGDFTYELGTITDGANTIHKVNTGAVATAIVITFDASYTHKSVNEVVTAYTLPAGASKEYFIFFLVEGTTVEVSVIDGTSGETITFASASEINAETNADKAIASDQLAASKYLDQDGTKVSATLSGTNTYTATISPAITAYANGQSWYLKATNGSTDASTLNLNSIGAKKMYKTPTVQIGNSDLVANGIYLFQYDSTLDSAVGGFLLIGGLGGVNIVSGDDKKVLYNNSGSIGQSADFKYDDTLKELTVGASSSASFYIFSQVATNNNSGWKIPPALAIAAKWFSDNFTFGHLDDAVGKWVFKRTIRREIGGVVEITGASTSSTSATPVIVEAITVASGETVTIETKVDAKVSGAATSTHKKLIGSFKNVAGVLSQIGSTSVVHNVNNSYGDNSTTGIVTFVISGSTVQITFTGVAATTATVTSTTETTYL